MKVAVKIFLDAGARSCLDNNAFAASTVSWLERALLQEGSAHKDKANKGNNKVFFIFVLLS